MQNDYGNNRGLDEMVMVEEERKRSEEARRKKAEAERARKQREEAKRKKTAAEKARKEKDERHKARNERREQNEKHRNIAESTNFDTENSFSPKLNNGGIMKPERAPKRNHMDEYNSAIKEQDKLLDTIHKFQWENASTHTKAEAQAAKQMRDNVLAYKKKLEHDKVNANPADAHKYAQGTGGVANKPQALELIGDFEELESRMTPEYRELMFRRMRESGGGTVDAYAKGTGGVSDYNKGLQHAMGGSNKPNTPNVASEDAGSRNEYYDEMINRAADDYLNEWGGKDSAETKEAWEAYGKQVDELVEQRDAYNRAAMGADTSDVQGGGDKAVLLSADDTQAMHVGLEDEENAGVSDSYYEGMLNAYGNWSSEVGDAEAIASEIPDEDVSFGANPPDILATDNDILSNPYYQSVF